jgi:hypothetical protein
MKTKFLGALFALALCSAVVSAESPPSMDAAALQSIALANARTANALELATCASERSAVAAAAGGCTDTVCRVSIAAIAALTPCAAMRVQGIGQVQAPPAPQIIQAQREVSVGERIVGLFAGGVGKIFDTAIALGPSWLNYKLGTVQSNNQTALSIVASNNALGATQSTNGTFAAFGNNIQGTATAGFGAIGTVTSAGFATASALGTRPTSVTTIAGNGNATNGSSVATTTTTTTNTNNCPGGDGGNATGAPSGNAGTGPTGGASGAGGTGTAGTGGPVNCNAGRQ